MQWKSFFDISVNFTLLFEHPVFVELHIFPPIFELLLENHANKKSCIV